MDAPDWVLAEIAVLSKISSIRIKLMTAQIVSGLQGLPLDDAKLHKLTTESGLDVSETKAAVAALEHIVASAARFDCDEGVLENELQQLGLPKEHTLALCKTFKDKKEAMRASMAKRSLRVSRLGDVQWRVDHNLYSSAADNLSAPSAQLTMQVLRAAGSDGEDQGGDTKVSFHLTRDKLRVLLHELEAARDVMNTVE